MRTRELQADLEALGHDQLLELWFACQNLHNTLSVRIEQAVTIASTCPAGGLIEGGSRETSGTAQERAYDWLDGLRDALEHLTGKPSHGTLRTPCPWCTAVHGT